MSDDFQVNINGDIDVSVTPQTPAEETTVDYADLPSVSIRATGAYDAAASVVIKVPVGTTVSAARTLFNANSAGSRIPANFGAILNGAPVSGSTPLPIGSSLEFAAQSKGRG